MLTSYPMWLKLSGIETLPANQADQRFIHAFASVGNKGMGKQ